jgi:hypothetical protein
MECPAPLKPRSKCVFRDARLPRQQGPANRGTRSRSSIPGQLLEATQLTEQVGLILGCRIISGCPVDVHYPSVSALTFTISRHTSGAIPRCPPFDQLTNARICDAGPLAAGVYSRCARGAAQSRRAHAGTPYRYLGGAPASPRSCCPRTPASVSALIHGLHADPQESTGAIEQASEQ